MKRILLSTLFLILTLTSSLSAMEQKPELTIFDVFDGHTWGWHKDKKTGAWHHAEQYDSEGKLILESNKNDPKSKSSASKFFGNLFSLFSNDTKKEQGLTQPIPAFNAKIMAQLPVEIQAKISAQIIQATPQAFELAATISEHTGFVNSVGFSQDNTQIITTGQHHRDHQHILKIWDSRTGTCLRLLTWHEGNFNLTQIDKASEELGREERMHWIPEIGADGYQFPWHEGTLRLGQLNHNNHPILIASDKNSTKFFDVATSTCFLTLDIPHIRSAHFNHDDTQLVTVSHSIVQIWDIQTNQLLQTLRHGKSVSSARFIHNGTQLVTTSLDDESAKIWDAQAGNCLLTLKGHEGEVYTAHVNHDGSLLVTASGDKTAKIWDTKTGNCLLTLKGHEDQVYTAHFNHDGSLIATTSKDKTTKIWDTKTGNCLLTLTGHKNWVTSADFNHDSSQIVTTSYDRTTKIWPLNLINTAYAKHFLTLKQTLFIMLLYSYRYHKDYKAGTPLYLNKLDARLNITELIAIFYSFENAVQKALTTKYNLVIPEKLESVTQQVAQATIDAQSSIALRRRIIADAAEKRRQLNNNNQ